MAFEKALAAVLPDTFEVPETMIENVVKERFAATLADARARGTSDEELQKLITEENYRKYKKIATPQCVTAIKGNLAMKAVGTAQGLSVPRSEIDDEVMLLQAQALQRGEKFKESEVRPKVEATMEKNIVLAWLEKNGSVKTVPATEFDPTEVLGVSPEELAKQLKEDEEAEKAKKKE